MVSVIPSRTDQPTTIGSSLRCESDGYPVEFQWKDVTHGNILSNASTLKLLNNGSYRLECIGTSISMNGGANTSISSGVVNVTVIAARTGRLINVQT